MDSLEFHPMELQKMSTVSGDCSKNCRKNIIKSQWRFRVSFKNFEKNLKTWNLNLKTWTTSSSSQSSGVEKIHEEKFSEKYRFAQRRLPWIFRKSFENCSDVLRTFQKIRKFQKPEISWTLPSKYYWYVIISTHRNSTSIRVTGISGMLQNFK